jgi:hypothetical protein
MIYSWKSGFHATISAATFGQHYEQLQRQHAEIDAELLVQSATSPTSPIHHAFEWDNQIAGHQYRLTQARHMLAAVMAIDEAIPDRGPTKFLVSVVSKAEEPSMKVYVPLVTAMANPVRRQEVLQQALRELRAFQVKYRELTELAGVFEALAKAEVNSLNPSDEAPL